MWCNHNLFCVRTTAALILGAGLLAGCVGPMERTRPLSGQILWVVHTTEYSLARARRKLGGAALPETTRLNGFAIWTGFLPDGTCTIHTLYPGAYENAQKFGNLVAHEFRHCAEGNYHD